MKNDFPKFVKGAMVPRLGKTTKFINMMIKGHFLANNIPLTKEQFIVLLCLEERPKPQSSLANITERDKGSLTRLVQSLEKKKYVKRKVCSEDNRVNHVEMTAKGKVILNKTKPVISELFDRIQVNIDEKEKEIAMRVIEQIQNNALKEIETLEHIKN